VKTSFAVKRLKSLEDYVFLQKIGFQKMKPTASCSLRIRMSETFKRKTAQKNITFLKKKMIAIFLNDPLTI
jgi:hypothetical protein